VTGTGRPECFANSIRSIRPQEHPGSEIQPIR
jgi:hypothetical protein